VVIVEEKKPFVGRWKKASFRKKIQKQGGGRLSPEMGPELYLTLRGGKTSRNFWEDGRKGSSSLIFVKGEKILEIQ